MLFRSSVFIESGVDSGFLRDSAIWDSRFCGIVESLVD